jgi:hypothetical protein
MDLEQPPEIRRAGFLLTLEEELEVHRRLDAAGLERIEGRQHRDDRPLVVARGSRVDA